jgi:hypothetical protein
MVWWYLGGIGACALVLGIMFFFFLKANKFLGD